MGKKTKTNKKPKLAMSVCRDCKRKARVPRSEYFRSSAPRCMVCGGMMDYLPFLRGAK